MTKYLDKSFTVPYISDDYRNNYDRVFGKKEEEPSERFISIQPVKPTEPSYEELVRALGEMVEATRWSGPPMTVWARAAEVLSRARGIASTTDK